jgi:glucose/mannose-6-phosphate isomerase
MGGSAVGGDVVRAAFADRLPVPVEVLRSPTLPAYVGRSTLVVASSFSGDTAETNVAFDEALARGCRVVAVTSGGRLGTVAADRSLPCARVPAGGQPRAALGQLAGALIGILETSGVLREAAGEVDEATSTLAALADTLGPGAPTSVNPAKRVASWIGDRVPLVWGATGPAAVAADRWRTQMNENAKVPAFSASMSELDHNEIVGWHGDGGRRFAIVALRVEGEGDDLDARYAFTAEVARAAGSIVEEVWATGDGRLARLLSLASIGDFASTYLAVLRGVDPTPVDAITRLKETLR